MGEKIQQFLKQKFPEISITAVADARNIVTLSGECESWQQLVDVGHAVAKLENVKNVVSDMTVRGMAIPGRD